jgi:hypothetical protein
MSHIYDRLTRWAHVRGPEDWWDQQGVSSLKSYPWNIICRWISWDKKFADLMIAIFPEIVGRVAMFPPIGIEIIHRALSCGRMWGTVRSDGEKSRTIYTCWIPNWTRVTLLCDNGCIGAASLDHVSTTRNDTVSISTSVSWAWEDLEID